MILYFTVELTHGSLADTGGSGWRSGSNFLFYYENDLIFGSPLDFQISSEGYLVSNPFVSVGGLFIFQNRVIYRHSDNSGNLGYINYYPVSNDEFLDVSSQCPLLTPDCYQPLIVDPVSQPVYEPTFPFFLVLCLAFLLKLLPSRAC